MKPIPNYEDYLIDEYGNVYSTKTDSFLVGYINISNRIYISLSKNNKSRMFMLAKLVYKVFNSPIPTDGIYHTDENIQNCFNENLQSCSKSAQRAQALRYNRIPKGVSKWSQGDYTRYRAYIKINGEVKTIGYFKKKKDAMKAFKDKYLEIYGVAI